MRAGKLRHRVTLLSVTDTRQTGGTLSQVETPIAPVWAEIEPLRGREFVAARQVQSEITTKITIRHYPGLTTKHRIRHGATTYDIVEPPADYQKRGIWLEIMCKERSA